MKTYKWFKQHNYIRPQNIIKQTEPQQKYRLETISKIQLLGEGALTDFTGP